MALLSVGGDANDQNLPQSGRLLYCVRRDFSTSSASAQSSALFPLDSLKLNHPQPRADGALPSSAIGALVFTEERYYGGFVEMGGRRIGGVVVGVRHNEEGFVGAEGGVVHAPCVLRRTDFVILACDE